MRLKALFFVGMFIVVTGTNAFATRFLDTAEHRYETAIDDLAERGIVQGYDDGRYKPNQLVNRAELLKVLIETQYPDYPAPDDLRCFEDFIFNQAPWYARPVCIGRELGIVQGYPDGTFKPDRTVNLAEAIKMATLATGYLPEEAKGGEAWYIPFIKIARDRDALPDLLASPSRSLTRGEMASLIHSLLILSQPDAAEDESSGGAAVCGNGVMEGYEQCDDGNKENGDGCSKICIIVPEPMRHGALLITQEGIATVSNVSAGKKDVPLFRFIATAGRQNVRLTQILFTPSVGSLVYAKNYELAMDRDGDGKYETIAQSVGRTEGNVLIFDDFPDGALLLHKDLTIPFEVRADVSQTTGPIVLSIVFDTDNAAYIGAVGESDGRLLTGISTDGSCPGSQICWISVDTGSSGQIEVNEKGSLYVTTSDMPVTNHQTLASAISDPVMRLQFRATGEDIDVTDIRIEGGVSSIESLLLYRDGNAQPFTQASTSQCSTVAATRFCANLPGETFIVKREEEVEVLVKAKLKPDALGAVSGQSFALQLTDGTSSFPAIEARGLSSTQTIAQNDNDSTEEGEIFIGRSSPGSNAAISGTTHDVVFAKILQIEEASAYPPGYSVPTGQTNIAAFIVSAAAHANSHLGSNDVVITTMVFHVGAVNVQLDPASFRLSNKANPDTYSSCTAPATTGSFDVTCTGIGSSSIQHRITSGQNVTFVLEGNITNAQVLPGNSSLSTSLSPLGRRNGDSAITWNDEEQTFLWLDYPETSVDSAQFHSG